jgi:hypothetical protein
MHLDESLAGLSDFTCRWPLKPEHISCLCCIQLPVQQELLLHLARGMARAGVTGKLACEQAKG